MCPGFWLWVLQRKRPALLCLDLGRTDAALKSFESSPGDRPGNQPTDKVVARDSPETRGRMKAELVAMVIGAALAFPAHSGPHYTAECKARAAASILVISFHVPRTRPDGPQRHSLGPFDVRARVARVVRGRAAPRSTVSQDALINFWDLTTGSLQNRRFRAAGGSFLKIVYFDDAGRPLDGTEPRVIGPGALFQKELRAAEASQRDTHTNLEACSERPSRAHLDGLMPCLMIEITWAWTKCHAARIEGGPVLSGLFEVRHPAQSEALSSASASRDAAQTVALSGSLQSRHASSWQGKTAGRGHIRTRTRRR